MKIFFCLHFIIAAFCNFFVILANSNDIIIEFFNKSLDIYAASRLILLKQTSLKITTAQQMPANILPTERFLQPHGAPEAPTRALAVHFLRFATMLSLAITFAELFTALRQITLLVEFSSFCSR
jgi:hypothetical protein